MKAFENRRALIIDDEQVICHVCEKVLSNMGFVVDIVNDGNSAEKSVAEQQYDLLLVDIRLPVESGIEFYTWLKQEYPQLSKHVIFMTGSVMGGETMSFLEKSNQPYLLKPFRPEELVSTLAEL